MTAEEEKLFELSQDLMDAALNNDDEESKG